MAKRVIELPFLRGQDEGVDQKLLAEVAPKGTLARAVNVRLRKDGRLGMRRDYTSLTMTSSAGTLVAADVINFDGRLCALGDSNGRGYPSDIYEYVNASVAWVGSEADGDRRLSFVSTLRDMGRLPATGVACTAVDVAAANGWVCMVSSDATQSFVTVFRADNGSKLLVERSTALLFRPRVVAISNVFYIAGIDSAGTAITLRSFDPAANTATQAVSTPFAAGAAIVAWDMTTNTGGTELIMAVARSTPTSEIRRVNTAGTTLQTVAGPATLFDFVSVWNDGTRIHLLDVPDATRLIRLSTYLVSGGALENGPTTLMSSGTTLQQPSLVQRSSTLIRVVAQLDSATTTVQLGVQDVTVSTHALGGLITEWRSSYLTSKPFGLLNASNSLRDPLTGGRFLAPDSANFLALLNSNPLGAKDHAIGGDDLGQLPHLARDAMTGKYYWANVTSDADGLSTPLVTEFDVQTNARVQTASLGGHLYLALGALSVYDGREMAESGFLDSPVIISAVPSNGAGSLTPSVIYSVAVVWEKLDALGNLHASAPSAVAQVTMGASDDTITVSVTTPHSIRKNSTHSNFAGTVRVVAYCSLANGDQLHRATVENAGNSFLGNAQTLSVFGPDATLETQAVIYTQGDRGALSGPLPFETALPCKYVWASKERLLIGGLPAAAQMQESRPLFPSEPVQWSLGLGFFALVRGDITAVAILDERRYVFTREEIFTVPGEGIDDTGNGVLGPPQKVPSVTGCIDWRSLCEIGEGMLFQGDTDKIYILPRSGSSPVWIGQPVRDTLAAYPTITSASFCRADQTACFTCNNVAGNDGRILVYDTRAQTWYVDEPLSAETYRASAAVNGRLVYVNGSGTVRDQQTTETPSTFIPMTLETPDIYPAGVDGWANIYAASLLCEFRGNVILTLAYSLDGGVSYTTHARTYSLSGLSVGARVRRLWTLGPFQAEAVRLRFTATALSGAATAGVTWHSYGIYAEGVEGLARSPADGQG